MLDSEREGAIKRDFRRDPEIFCELALKEPRGLWGDRLERHL